MIDENDLSQERKHIYGERGKKAADRLQKRNINARFASTSEEALSLVIAMIPEDVKVVKGDSMSVEGRGHRG